MSEQEYYATLIQKTDEIVWIAIRSEEEENVTAALGIQRCLGAAYEQGLQALKDFEFDYLVTEEECAQHLEGLGFEIVKKGE